MTHTPPARPNRIAVVDGSNRFLCWEDREIVHRDQLPHRTIHVLLFDTTGRLLVQRRHREKLTHPGCLDLSCAGHVEEDDYPAGPDEQLDAVYDATARREVLEELGVSPTLHRLGVFAPVPGVHYEHIALYRGTHDGPFIPQAEEVEEVRFMTRGQVAALLASSAPVPPLTDTFAWFGALAETYGWWP